VRAALAAALLLAGCATPPPKPEVVTVPETVVLRAVTDLAISGFAQYCLGAVGRPALMVERLKADGFAPVPEANQPPAPFRQEIWRGAARPFIVSVIEGGGGCSVVAPRADTAHAMALLGQAMQRLVDEGAPVAPLVAPAAEPLADGAREDRYQIRPRNGPLVIDVSIRTNLPHATRPALILLATVRRDNATRT
jgi:hypothetical protein